MNETKRNRRFIYVSSTQCAMRTWVFTMYYGGECVGNIQQRRNNIHLSLPQRAQWEQCFIRRTMATFDDELR